MPKFSAFTPFGILAFSRSPSDLELQYKSLGLQLDQAFDTTPGDPDSLDNEAEKYATARHLARVNLTLQKAGNQRDVTKASDLLPLREADFLAVPGPYDSLLTRQNRLEALRALPLGATSSNIRSALQNTLGSAFLGLRLVAPSEITTDLPTSNFQPLGVESKVLQLTLPVAITGSQWATYANLDSTDPANVLLALGDSVTVQGENNDLAEVVTVTGILTNQFQATFTNSHDVGSTVTTMPFPRWGSNQSFLYVEVTPSAAANIVLRSQVEALMAKLTRGVTQWAIVGVSGGHIGPNVMGTTPLGTATIGTVAA